MDRLMPVGRTLFAVAMMGFGVLCLGFVNFVHQLQPIETLVPATTPGYGVLAILTGAFLMAAGVAIASNAMIRPATIALTVVFSAWIVLLQVPSAFIDPSLLRSPWWVRTFETVALTGAALVLAGLASQPERERWVRIGRVLFGVSLPVFGVLHFIYAEGTATLVPSMYPWPLAWIYITGAGNIAGGIAIATGVLSRLAAILAGIMYGTYALTLHIPRALTVHGPNLFTGVPAELQSARGGLTSLFVAIGMCGAAWIVAGSLAVRGSSAVQEPKREARRSRDTAPGVIGSNVST